MRKKSNEELLSELQECYEKHGKVNRRIFNEDDKFSSGKTIYNHFGSFSKGCEEAGIPHENKPQKKEKISVSCENCGKEKEVYPYRLKENKNGRFFCDNSCQGIWWSNNLSGEDHPLYEGASEWSTKFGAMWHKKRDKCLKRDGYMCVVCRTRHDEHIEEYGFGLDVHHIIPRRKFYKDESLSIDEANNMENLVSLCREHHSKLESGEIKLEEYK